MQYKEPVDVIKQVGVYLSVALPLEKNLLMVHLQGLESVQFELAKSRTEQHKIYAEMRNRMLHPKDKDMTELDRNVMLDSHVAVIRKDYELLLRLEELVTSRIELGKIFLQYM